MKALSFFLPVLLAACGGAGDTDTLPDDRFELFTVGADSCVRDGISGLVWESKAATEGLHDRDNTYSWWNPDEATGELDYRGAENAGECRGSRCDTFSFVAAVNSEAYCGYNDWRMPTKDELNSISDVTRASQPPTIDTRYFPHTHPDEYWTGNDYSFQYNAAWGWNFQYGLDRVDWKKSAKFVRLVRGTPQALPAVKE